MLLEPGMTPAEMARSLGWELKPEGLCRADICVPLEKRTNAGIAAALHRPLVTDRKSKLMAIGPPAGHALPSAKAPSLELSDWQGKDFSLSTLLSSKVLIIAWAPW